MLTADKTIKDGDHNYLQVNLKSDIIQDCKHSDEYRERVGGNCCDLYRYRAQDIRVQDCEHSDEYREYRESVGGNCCDLHRYRAQDTREPLKEYY